MHAEYLQVLSCQLVVQVEIACLFIVAVNFIFLAYEKPVVVIDAADASLQQGGELLCGKVELRHSLCAKDIYFPVAVACYPGYVVAKKGCSDRSFSTCRSVCRFRHSGSILPVCLSTKCRFHRYKGC